MPVFREVRTMNENRYPVELMANKSTIKAIISNLNIDERAPEELARSVASIQVQGMK
jgi:type III secretion system FlhB-like substrate exporter